MFLSTGRRNYCYVHLYLYVHMQATTKEEDETQQILYQSLSLRQQEAFSTCLQSVHIVHY